MATIGTAMFQFEQSNGSEIYVQCVNTMDVEAASFSSSPTSSSSSRPLSTADGSPKVEHVAVVTVRKIWYVIECCIDCVKKDVM